MALPYVCWEGETFSLLSILMASSVGYPWVLCTPPWAERTKVTSLMGYFESGAVTCTPVNFLSFEACSWPSINLAIKALDMGEASKGPALLVAG